MKRYMPRFRFRIDDEAHLQSLADAKLPLWKVICFLCLALIISIFLGSIVVMTTPLRNLLPGYLKEDQRGATEEHLLRLDSLTAVYDANSRYIENLLKVTDVKRIPDSIASSAPDSLYDGDSPFNLSGSDQLLQPSSRERSFAARMQERERFNVAVLAPLAANGMDFHNPAPEGIVSSDSRQATAAEIILPRYSDIMAIADGSVVAAYYSPSLRSHEVVIQHDHGFISKYSHTGSLSVASGEKVLAGQVISHGPGPDSKGRRAFTLRLWHDGDELIPFEYIGRHKPEKEEAPKAN